MNGDAALRLLQLVQNFTSAPASDEFSRAVRAQVEVTGQLFEGLHERMAQAFEGCITNRTRRFID